MFKITHYCPCPICCGEWSGLNRTFSGTVPTAGRTIGVDPDVIPLGSKVKINGHTYIAEDTGNMKGNRIDIFVGNHEEAILLGTYDIEIYIYQ